MTNIPHCPYCPRKRCKILVLRSASSMVDTGFQLHPKAVRDEATIREIGVHNI